MYIKISVFYQPMAWATEDLDRSWLKPISDPAMAALASKLPFSCTRTSSLWSGVKLVLGTNPVKNVYSLFAEIHHEH